MTETRATPLSPAAAEWHRSKIAQWSARADDLRAAGGRGNLNCALGLEWVVREMTAALGVIPPVSSPEIRAIAELEARLAGCQPRLYPGTDIMTGTGPIMDAVRHKLRCRIAALRGEPAPIAAVAPRPPVLLPPAEALPFTAGPQLDLFGAAA